MLKTSSEGIKNAWIHKSGSGLERESVLCFIPSPHTNSEEILNLSTGIPLWFSATSFCFLELSYNEHSLD